MKHTDLGGFLRRQIAASGPMPLSEFMGHCVSRYYADCDPFGREGDFITAPEISQMFGEIIGLWAAVVWRQLGAPDPVLLVELGPGRGSLMADALRAAAAMPAFRRAIRVYLVENSRALRQRQQETLGEGRAQWCDRPADLPPGPMILIANEFFDALPIDQYVRRSDAWHERHIDCRQDQFHFIDGPAVSDRKLRDLGAPEAQLGDIFEVNPLARGIAAMLGQRFCGEAGAALIIDYGHAETGLGDTLQAVRRHQTVPVLEAPGEADLTAHVDFAALRRAAAPASATQVVSQGNFLRRLGLELRARKLAAARPDQATAIEQACQRLLGPQAMGGLFKVMALSSAMTGDLPGFA